MDLTYSTKNAWETFDSAEKERVFSFCEDYKSFLNNAKTERLATKEAVKIAKEKCKIIGRVCMDCFFVLLGDGNYRIGQNVKLFCNAKQFAKAAKISVYECLTNFNKLR